MSLTNFKPFSRDLFILTITYTTLHVFFDFRHVSVQNSGIFRIVVDIRVGKTVLKLSIMQSC